MYILPLSFFYSSTRQKSNEQYLWGFVYSIRKTSSQGLCTDLILSNIYLYLYLHLYLYLYHLYLSISIYFQCHPIRDHQSDIDFLLLFSQQLLHLAHRFVTLFLWAHQTPMQSLSFMSSIHPIESTFTSFIAYHPPGSILSDTVFVSPQLLEGTFA